MEQQEPVASRPGSGTELDREIPDLCDRSPGDVWLEVTAKSRIWQAEQAPIFTLSRNVRNRIIEVTDSETRRFSDEGRGQRHAPVPRAEGPGQAFDPAGPDDQTSDCSYVFQWDSSFEDDNTFDASATVERAVTYQASTGQAGDLYPITRTTEFPLTVSQRQAVVCHGDPDECDVT